jgi:succinate dehydrogenase / fumarate reductase, iron-sulfur subunit
MDFYLKVWRQKDATAKGSFMSIDAKEISADTSFLEMLDIVNERLIEKGEEPIAFDHDCREGICGTCGCVVNGFAHGHQKGTTLCQLHMRSFKDKETVIIEPWRAGAFPVLKDLIVDRSAFDHIIQAGGFIAVGTGAPQDANAIPIPKATAELAMDAAACIGCGACVASCPNASAMLFTSAKLSQLALLPQGHPERTVRAKNMVAAMERAGFGACTNHGECEATCPKEVSVNFIAKLNRELIRASLRQ